MGAYAFYLCTKLTRIVLTTGLPMLGEHMFDLSGSTTNLLAIVTVPSRLTFIGILLESVIIYS